MDIIHVAQDLIRFRTETGNRPEIIKCLNYIKDLFAGTAAKTEIFEQGDLAPVIFIRNTDSEQFDVLVLGHLDVVKADDEMFEPVIKGDKCTDAARWI